MNFRQRVHGELVAALALGVIGAVVVMLGPAEAEAPKSMIIREFVGCSLLFAGFVLLVTWVVRR
jgi:hypothetical protein